MFTASVIIPTYNGKELLEKNLPAVIASMRIGDELIIVDDASTDTTVEWLQKTYRVQSQESQSKDFLLWSGKVGAIQLKVLGNIHNQRFAQSCNHGVVVATNDIIVLLNSDVIPRKDFLTPLLVPFQDNTVFAVGSKELATAENNKEYGRSGGKFARGFLIHWRESNQNETDTLWVAGGSGAFRRSMWNKLGGFDLDYRPAYWEDIDLSWRARQKGWKILFEPTSIVYHNHETTNASVFGKKQMEVMAFKNQILFMWKNARGTELVKHFLWLPYHLIFTTLRSNGAFFVGFVKALVAQIA